jgi:hypothetical protein
MVAEVETAAVNAARRAAPPRQTSREDENRAIRRLLTEAGIAIPADVNLNDVLSEDRVLAALERPATPPAGSISSNEDTGSSFSRQFHAPPSRPRMSAGSSGTGGTQLTSPRMASTEEQPSPLVTATTPGADQSATPVTTSTPARDQPGPSRVFGENIPAADAFYRYWFPIESALERAGEQFELTYDSSAARRSPTEPSARDRAEAGPSSRPAPGSPRRGRSRERTEPVPGCTRRTASTGSRRTIDPAWIPYLPFGMPTPPTPFTGEDLERIYTKFLKDEAKKKKEKERMRCFVQHESFELPPGEDSDADSDDISIVAEVAAPPDRRPLGRGTVDGYGRRSPSYTPRRTRAADGSITMQDLIRTQRSGFGTFRDLPLHGRPFAILDMYLSPTHGLPVITNLLMFPDRHAPADESNRPGHVSLEMYQCPPAFQPHNVANMPPGPIVENQQAHNIVVVTLGEARNFGLATRYGNYRRVQVTQDQLNEVSTELPFLWSGHVWGQTARVVHIDIANAHLAFGGTQEKLTAEMVLGCLEAMGFDTSTNWGLIVLFGCKNDCRWLAQATPEAVSYLRPGGQPLIGDARAEIGRRVEAFQVRKLPPHSIFNKTVS